MRKRIKYDLFTAEQSRSFCRAIGNYLYATGSEGFGRHFFGNPKKLSTWTNGRPYVAPLWLGYRVGNQISRVGISRQWVHNWTQNFIHAFGLQNYYMSYDEFRSGTYMYSGYYSPYSLWGY